MQSREGMPLGKARCWASQDGPMLGPAMDGGGAVAPAEDAADGDDGDIDQEVLAIARVPGVGERFEVGADGADVDELRGPSHTVRDRRKLRKPPYAEARQLAESGGDPAFGAGEAVPRPANLSRSAELFLTRRLLISSPVRGRSR